MPSSLQIIRKFYGHVKRVVDAKRPLVIEVTDGDVKAALRKEHSSCAVAEAVSRSFAIDGAIISTRTGYLIEGGTATRYSVPECVAREIISYDRGGPFMVGVYTLLPPTRRAPWGKGTRHQGSPASGKLRHRHVTEGVRDRLGSALTPPKRGRKGTAK